MTVPSNDRDAPPRMPRWVKISGLIAIIALLLLIAVMLIGGGGHGPGRHLHGGGGQATSSVHTGTPGTPT